MENVLSSAMDVTERVSIGNGVLDGYAIRSVDLAGINLERRRFSNVTLTRVGLTEARLGRWTGNDVQFSESVLRKIDFSMAHVQRGSFVNCEAFEMNCRGALFEHTKWFESQLPNVNMDSARLIQCEFQSAELYGAQFQGALLAQCRFSDPRMGHASLSRANFQHAMLIDVDFEGANLHAADFTGAVLVRVNLKGSNLVRADLRDVVMIDCKHHSADLDGALLG